MKKFEAKSQGKRGGGALSGEIKKQRHVEGGDSGRPFGRVLHLSFTIKSKGKPNHNGGNLVKRGTYVDDWRQHVGTRTRGERLLHK